MTGDKLQSAGDRDEAPAPLARGHRRGFLRGFALGGLALRAGALAIPGAAGLFGLLPGRAEAVLPSRALWLHSRELGEAVSTVYFADGDYRPEAMTEIKRIFRDKHNDREIDIDPRLLDLLWVVQRRLASNDGLELVCGYRSPETNAMLRERSRAVAQNSFHMYGQAIDLRIPGRPLSDLHELGLTLQTGGVGYYPRSNFVHLDTGPVRTWGESGASSSTPSRSSGSHSPSRSTASRSRSSATTRVSTGRGKATGKPAPGKPAQRAGVTLKPAARKGRKTPKA